MASALALARSLDFIMLAETATRILPSARPGSFKTTTVAVPIFTRPRPTDLMLAHIAAQVLALA